jgi:hypothetical protein
MADTALIRSLQNKGWGPIHARLLATCVKLENSGWKKGTGMTQAQRIIEHIKKNGSITQREAFIDYSIQNFSARLSEIKQAGYNVVKREKKHPVTGQKYSRYYLAA